MSKDNRYDHKSIEPKWDQQWSDKKIYQPNLET